MKWWDQLPWSQFFESWILSQLFHSSFTLIKRLFSSLSAIIVVSSAYLRFLIFLPAISIPACNSSSLAFHMMYFACKLNKQGDNMQPSHTPFPILSQSIVPCLVLTAASWPTYRFCRRQGKVIWYSHLFSNFPTVCCDPHSQWVKAALTIKSKLWPFLSYSQTH